MFWNKKKKGKVFVGVSGGVDSAVSLFLLKKQGYDVYGVFIKTWQPEFIKCTWPEERRDAISICASLNVPFLEIDLSNDYKEKVADYMIDSYKKGLTPNPDVMCNQEIKFGAFFDWAITKGADFIATGHYSFVKKNGNRQHLYRGIDNQKDQSYFLWAVSSEKLKKIIFPIGNLKKSKVRKIAKKNNIPVFDKKDSQGICFLGMIKMEEFLLNYIDKKPGDVVDQNGNIIGQHSGVCFYTLGQRHGFVISSKDSARNRLYVIKKDLERNVLTVGNKEVLLNKDKKSDIIFLEKCNFLEPDYFKKDNIIDCQIRYHGVIKKIKILDSDFNNKKISCYLEEKDMSLSTGQSIVFYKKNLCLGGGIVT